MILRVLTLESLHGHALVTRIRQRSDQRLAIEEGSLYPVLQRLLKDGLVGAQWELSPAHRRVRAYSLTAAGRRNLKRDSARWQAMMDGIQRVLAPAPDPQP